MDYTELGKLTNQQLAKQRGITLPVLESPTSFEFIESVLGRPASRQSRKSFVTVNFKTGDVYPLSREDAQSLGFAGGSVADPLQGRKVVGTPVLDVRQSPKSVESWARMGEGAEDWEQLTDFAEEGLGVANMGSVEMHQARSPQEQRRATSPAVKPLFTGGPLVGATQEMFLVPETNLQRYPAGVSVGKRLAYTEQPTQKRVLRFGSLGEQLQALDPEHIGTSMQSVREQLATIKPKEIVFSQEQLPSNLEVVTKQLMAQAGRRAGKRRIR